MIHRCYACDRLIWPWQKVNAVVVTDGSLYRWHVGCSRDALRKATHVLEQRGLAPSLALLEEAEAAFIEAWRALNRARAAIGVAPVPLYSSLEDFASKHLAGLDGGGGGGAGRGGDQGQGDGGQGDDPVQHG